MAKTYGLMRLGRDAEIRRTPAGEAVANLSLAYNYGKKEGDSRPTQWVDAAIWGARAEALAPYLVKGSLHLFSLRDIHMEKYADKDGFDAYKLVATVDDVELGPKGDSAPREGSSSAGGGQRRPASMGGATGGTSRPGGASASSPQTGFTDDDSDVPF